MNKKEKENYDGLIGIKNLFQEELTKSNMAFDILFEITKPSDVRDLLAELKELRLYKALKQNE